MQLGTIGLGWLGKNPVRRLSQDSHQCVVYDRNPEVSRQLACYYVKVDDTCADPVRQLDRSATVWGMVPASVDNGIVNEKTSHNV